MSIPCIRGPRVGGDRLNARVRNVLLAGCAILVATTVARAQPADPIGDILSGAQLPGAPQPYAKAGQTVAQPLSGADQALFAQGLAAAKRADIAGAKSAISSLSDPSAPTARRAPRAPWRWPRPGAAWGVRRTPPA